MRRYVKNLSEYMIGEALNKAEWLNYKNETSLNSPNPDQDILNVSILVQKLLNVDDASKILFTGEDVTISEDFRYFTERLIPSSEKKDEGTYNESGYMAYYTLYQNGNAFFVKFDIRDAYEYSYIFIRESDYDYFDKLDAPVIPELPAETPVQETPTEEAPAQPRGQGGGGLV